MALLPNVGEMFTLPHFYHRATLLVINFINWGINTAPIYLGFHRNSVIENIFPQEAESCFRIFRRGQQEGDGLTKHNRRSITTFPLV